MESLLPDQLRVLAQLVVAENKDVNRMIATAESCTGGLVSTALTEIAGSSAVLDSGFVTYSYESKSELLDIDLSYIHQHTAVSTEVVAAMAKGAIKNSQADIAVSISGIAGPGGAVPGKPIGTVAFGLADKNGLMHCSMEQFNPNLSRAEIRLEAALLALEWLRP